MEGRLFEWSHGAYRQKLHDCSYLRIKPQEFVADTGESLDEVLERAGWQDVLPFTDQNGIDLDEMLLEAAAHPS